MECSNMPSVYYSFAIAKAITKDTVHDTHLEKMAFQLGHETLVEFQEAEHLYFIGKKARKTMMKQGGWHACVRRAYDGEKAVELGSEGKASLSWWKISPKNFDSTFDVTVSESKSFQKEENKSQIIKMSNKIYPLIYQSIT